MKHPPTVHRRHTPGGAALTGTAPRRRADFLLHTASFVGHVAQNSCGPSWQLHPRWPR